jgi:xanthine dehydrogenase molybdenum-binding subunit
MSILKMTVNGNLVELEVPESRFLAEVLRYDLGLTGTKIGCNEAECGICTVLVDGQPVDSCIFPAFKVQGRQVLTIEGLGEGGVSEPSSLSTPAPLHPLQQAFVDYDAVQCGFCTPGLIMTGAALLDQKASRGEPVTDADVKDALKDTFCRCTGYVSVINAIKAAAVEMGVDAQPPAPGPLPPETKTPLQVVGRALPRTDAVQKVTGAALYTDDYHFPGMLTARTKRAGVPHARIQAIHTQRAQALPGVRAVLTHRDVPGSKNHGLVENDWPVLAYDVVRYVGDALAIVAADTPEIAAQALDLISVDYEALPVVPDPVTARRPGAPVVHSERPEGNLLKHIKVRKGDVDSGFAEADVIVERTYRTPTTEHAFMEPECAIGVPAGYDPSQHGGRLDPKARSGIQARHDKLSVYVGSQIPYADRDQVAASLGLEPEAVRVVGTLIGGGFGGKEDIVGQIHVALLARATGRPVKMLYSRQESLLVHPKRHATVIRVKTGARRDGRLTAVEAELYGDTGAYASLGEKVMTRATTHASGPYDVPHVKIDCYAMYTNNPPSGAFRGFGVTQSAFAVESNMDLLAHQLELDPIQLRRLNALRVGAITCTGQELRESVGLLECLEKVEGEVRRLVAQESAQADPWSPVRDAATPHKVRAWGIAVAYKNTGLGGGAPDKAEAEVEMWVDRLRGAVAEVRTSSAEMGQGLPTVLAQMAAEELGLPYPQVRVLLSDTDLTPDGGPTTASRQTYVSGNAVRYAARGLRDMLANVASEQLEAPPDQLIFADGQIRSQGRSVDIEKAVRWAEEEGRPTRFSFEYWAPQTQPLGTGGDMHVAFSFAAQAALVEVDSQTGMVQVLKVVGAHDVGRAINPRTLQGQVEGGIVMCIGNALTEHYIVEDGVPWTNVLARYKMPSIKHNPEIVSFIVEHETADGPYGAKGVGELPSIPTSPAITNAITNAVGVRVMSLPVDQDALHRALTAGQKEVWTAWGE